MLADLNLGRSAGLLRSGVDETPARLSEHPPGEQNLTIVLMSRHFPA